MTVLLFLRYFTALLGVILSIWYSYQFLYLFLPLVKKPKALPGEKPTRFAILIAARNEERVLPQLLKSIQAQDYPAALLTTYVIADNCADQTAEVARQWGAKVFCRQDTARIGKGYALRFLLDQIKGTSGLENYDAFLVFDADNVLQPDYIRNINRLPSSGYDVFCGYRNSKNFASSWVSAGHSIWYLHDSAHLNRSRMLLGVSCAVTGTGFGFTRRLLEQWGGWEFLTLTEDLEMNTWCAARGIRAGYCHEAVLYDEQPVKFSQSWRQRTRWIQGGIQVSLKYSRDLSRGILRCGRIGYSCLENASLSLWGIGAGALCGLLHLILEFSYGSWQAAGIWFLRATGWMIVTSLLMGAMTLLTEGRKIRATRAQKLLGLLVFPLHTLSYIPIGLSAPFRKFGWPPITHTVILPESLPQGKN